MLYTKEYAICRKKRKLLGVSADKNLKERTLNVLIAALNRNYLIQVEISVSIVEKRFDNKDNRNN